MSKISWKDDERQGSLLLPSLAGVAGTVLALLVLGRVWAAIQDTRLASAWTISLAGAVVLAAAVPLRRPLYRWLTSVPFSVGLLAAILVATALGTVIVQGAPPEDFSAKYPSLAGVLRLGGLDDVFHSFAFRGLLGLLALSLALVVVDRRGWRPAEWSFTLNHGGIVVILAGGLVGTCSGMRGFIDLREGQTARSFARRDRFDRPTGEKVALDFGLRLEKFEIERFPLEFRFYVYKREDQGFRPVSSRSLSEATQWEKAGASGREYRLLAAYPDFDMKTELRDSPEGQGGPALKLQLFDREGHVEDLVLLAGVPGRDGIVFKESRTTLRFVWEESDARVADRTLPERHVLFVRRLGTAGPEEEVSAAPGESRAVAGGHEVKVLAYYPDFDFDPKKQEGFSKSARPVNPVLKVSVRDADGRAQEGYVSSNNPSLAGTEGVAVLDLVLRYRYEPERKASEREIVVVGGTKEVLEYRSGALRERTRIPERRSEPLARGVSATFLQLSRWAEEVRTPITRTSNWRKPVAEVEVRSGGKVEKHFLKGAMPFDLGGEEALVFQPKPDDVKSYRSKVAVVVEGEPAVRETISVNHPLSHGGYRFYQSNFRREDPTYSGILVVKDPGLPLAYIGFVMICLGAIGRFYLQPWLQKRRLRA